MLSRTIFQVFAATLLSATVYGDYVPFCDPGGAGYGSLQCAVCGRPNSSGIICTAFNATFDDIKIHRPVTSGSNGVAFESLNVAARNKANPIYPSSEKHYARSISGTAIMDFTPATGGLGQIHSFTFACADPCTKTTSEKPVACKLTVTASCVELVDGGANGVSQWFYNGTFDYAPAAGARYAAMSPVDFDPVTANAPEPSGDDLSALTEFNFNYTFEAVMDNGKPAFLYLDDMIYNTWIIN